MRNKSFLSLFIVLLLTVVFIAGCERKTDEAEVPATDTTAIDTLGVDTTQTDTTGMNLQGTWSGSMGQQNSTLTITEFKDNKIKGTVNTRTRDGIVQNVEGTFIPETRTIRLSDQKRNREMGTYQGTISEDGNTISGTFTSNDKSITSKFNYKKNQ
jgi:hypothetical protein